MSAGARIGWVVWVAMLPMLTISLAQVKHADWARLWPIWRPMMLDALLVIAGVVLVTTVVGGVVAWRQTKRVHA